MFLSLINFLKGLFFFTGSYSNTVFPPPLSPKLEKEYISKMLDGDVNARNKLIEHNLRLVAHLVKRFDDKNISSDDLISIGTIGLIKGVDSYDVSKNIKITTYIAKCAENEILMYFRSSKKFNNEISLNDSFCTDKDGNDIALIDLIPSNDIDITTKILNDIDIELLHKYLDILPSKERDIIVMRYGLFNSDVFTQKEIAKKMKISRSYVSRMEKRALIKLYKEFYKK